MTENALVGDFQIARDVLWALRKQGIHISLDDFGTGYSSLRHLSELPFETLKIDREEADGESPALLEPMAGARIACWVGAAERSEFVRQNALLANAWTGLGAETLTVEEPDRHHFNVIDGLADPDHALTRTLLTG